MKASFVARVLAVRSDTLVRVACWLGLIAVPLMIVSVLVPTVWPVLAALTVGQGIGTLSFVLYLAVVVRDLGIARRLGRRP